jgi:hypothetical protein
LRPQLVAVEHDPRLRLIELQVRVGKHEHSALERLHDERVRDVRQLLRLGRRLNDQVDRKSPPPGSAGGVVGITRMPAICDSGP